MYGHLIMCLKQQYHPFCLDMQFTKRNSQEQSLQHEHWTWQSDKICIWVFMYVIWNELLAIVSVIDRQYLHSFRCTTKGEIIIRDDVLQTEIFISLKKHTWSYFMLTYALAIDTCPSSWSWVACREWVCVEIYLIQRTWYMSMSRPVGFPHTNVSICGQNYFVF